MNDGRHLVLIAIGPVQEFIASSRKLRDLWCGSFLLGDLSKATANALLARGCELIFPAPVPSEANGAVTLPEEMAVGNKIMAITNEDPAPVLAEAKAAYLEKWRAIARQASASLPAAALNGERFEAQVADCGEFYGCWTAIGKDYARARQWLESILSGRKGLRQFKAPGWEGAGLPKSSLDGTRETVIQDRAALERDFLLKAGEHLDALGVIKRLVPKLQPKASRPHFDNLAQVAVRPYLDGLARDMEAQKILAPLSTLAGRLSESFPPCHHGYVFLPENFPVELFLPSERFPWMDAEGDAAKAEARAVEKVMAALKRHTGKDPSPYGCLLVGDGDRMGRVLDRLRDPDAHRLFSQGLDRFARAMPAMVAEFGGRLIYSGGDDVMAYVPLHSALDLAVAINQDFENAMRKALDGQQVSPPTFSMGIAIVHHASPLNRALEVAREAERAAKEAGGRGSLAIIQSKRSGQDITIYGKWQGSGTTPGIAGRIGSIAALYNQGILSARLGYQLRRLSGEGGRSLAYVLPTSGPPVPQNAVSAETLRLIGRKRSSGGGRLDAAHDHALLAGQTDLRALADELVVARQIAEAQALAAAVWRNA